MLLHGSQATSADAEATGFITFLNCYALKIRFPATFGALLGMADIISELTALATDITFSRHTTVPPIWSRVADSLPSERSIRWSAVMIPQEGPTCKLGLGGCRERPFRLGVSRRCDGG